jgi:hypothetical protein
MAAATVTQADLENLEKALNASPNDAGVQRKLLACLRARKARRPDLVIRCGVSLLARQSNLGSTEVWDVREQVLLGALDLHIFEVAQEQLKLLEKQFPGSKRVKGLQAMFLEASACRSGISKQVFMISICLPGY